MKKTFTLLIALFALSLGAWAQTTVTWDYDDVASLQVAVHYGYTPQSQTIDGITITANAPAEGDYSHFITPPNQTPTINTDNGGKLTFAPESGNYLTSIIISCGSTGRVSSSDLARNWSWDSQYRILSWSGAATSVDLMGIETGNGILFENIQSVTFVTEVLPTPGSTVTWEETDLQTIDLPDYGIQTIKGISVTTNTPDVNDECTFRYYSEEQITGFSMLNNGSIIFSTEIGRFTSIVIACEIEFSIPTLDNGWTWDSSSKELKWSSTNSSSSVTLKGDGRLFSVAPITSIAFTYAGGTPTPTPVATKTITWEENELNQVLLGISTVGDMQATNDINGITAYLKKTGNNPGSGTNVCQFSSKEIYIDNNGELTFESSDGDIVGIEITCGMVWKDPSDFNLPAGWTYNNDGTNKSFTWAGAASDKVVLSGDIDFTVTSIEFTVTTDTPDPASTTITWDQTDVRSVNVWMHDGYSEQQYKSKTVKDITLSAKAPNSGDESNFSTAYDQGIYNSYIYIAYNGKLMFTPEVGKLLTKIVITCDGTEYISADHLAANSGWTYKNKKLTWKGSATAVTLACDGTSSGIYFGGITSVVYTVIPDPTPVTDPTIIWRDQQIKHVSFYCYPSDDDVKTTHVIRNIIASMQRSNNVGYCYFQNGRLEIENSNGTLKFKSIVGDIKGIVITCSYVSNADNLSTDWTYNDAANTLTWAGTAAEEVSISGDIDINISSIVFTYTPAPAPRLGEQFQGSYYHWYEITGAHTAKLPAQNLYGTLHGVEYEDYEGVRYYITEIDDYAFYNQNELPNAYIGENVARIGAHAFDGCIRMEECIIYSEVLDTIGEEAFKDCKIMAYVQCSTEQPPVLGSNAFSGDNYLNHFYVYENVVDAYKAASGWNALSSKIGKIGTPPSAGEIFFYRNQMTRGLYAVTVGSPNYSTKGEAKVMPYSGEVRSFYPIEYDGTLVISEEVTYMQRQYSITGIGPNAYKDSTRINVVLIPQAMKSIESGAFLNCTGVRNVIFLWDDPTTVTWADADKGLEFATAVSGETKIIVPEGKLATYQAWAPAWASCMIAGEVEDVTATADPEHSSRFYRTFYDSTKDYMMPPSVWAHAGYVRGNEFILYPVAYDGQILPKGTPVVLESETQDYRLIAIDGDAAAYTGPNDLRGTDVSFPRTDLGANADKVYVLGKQAGVGEDLKVGMGLYRYTGTNLGAHKAYMILDLSNIPESGDQPAPGRFLFRHEDTATSFENVQKDNDLCTKILRDGQLIIIRDGKQYNAQGMIIK